MLTEITAICEYVDEIAANGFRFAEGLKMFQNRIHCLPQAADDLKAAARSLALDGMRVG